MVTRRIEPSAFLVEVKVAYAILDQLFALWSSGDAPVPGLQPFAN